MPVLNASYRVFKFLPYLSQHLFYGPQSSKLHSHHVDADHKAQARGHSSQGAEPIFPPPSPPAAQTLLACLVAPLVR